MEQRDEVMAAQLRREQARTREQESRIDSLQQQLDLMKNIILRMQQPPCPSSSSDSEPDDGGGYTDDENDGGSCPSRPDSPVPPSRPSGRRTTSHSSSHSDDYGTHLPRPPSTIPAPPPKSTSRVSVAPALRPPSFVAKQPRRAQSTAQATPDRFAKADLSRLATALEPSKVERWINDLLETIEDYSPDAAWLLALPAPSARLVLGRYPHLRPLDRWAARQAINTLQTEKPYVRLLLNASTAEAIAARTSGVELLVYVRDRAGYCSGETARVRIAQFDAKSYFDTQMDAATTHLQADELRNDFLALPAERTAAPNGLLHALLKKLPASIALPKIMLEDKLTEVEAMGVQPPWTFDQLVNVVAQHILVAANRTDVVAISGAQVHTVETRGKKSSDPGLRPDQMKCPCCGQLGHRPRDCPTTCKSCKQRSCPGNYGAACIIVGKTFPTNVLNACGRPVPPNIKTILHKAHEKKAGQPQSKKTTNVLEATAISTDNPHLWDVMTNEEGKISNMLTAVLSLPEAPSAVAVGSVKEVCPTFKTADGRVRSTPHLIMVDGGSNINLFNNKAVTSLGIPLPGAPVQVSGWSDSVAQSIVANYRVDLQLKLIDGTMKRVTIDVAYSDQGRRDILSESLMWDMHSWSVLKEPAMRIDTPHGSVPLVRLNGIYFVEALLLPPRSTRTSALETNVLSAKRHGALHLARLWAARLHAGSSALRRQLPACSGLGIEEMTPAMAKVADQDILNKRSNARRAPAVRSSSAPTEPGELFIFDAYGPIAAQSVIDGSHYEFEATPATAPLDERQTRVQRMVGAMRYPEKVLPVLTLGLHRLSCVAQNPPPAASLVADLLLEVAFDHRFEGLTFGGSATTEASELQVVSAFGVEESDRPPLELEAYGDATWTTGLQHVQVAPPPLATIAKGGQEVASRDLYSVVLTFRGAAILHQTKKLALLVDCSMAAEEVATSKAAEYVEYASQIMRALDVASQEPVTIGTDNASNRQVAMRQGASSRSKHLLRRYYVLMQRIHAGEVKVVHVRDEANPADFLTKWVPAKKLRASVAYVSGQSARRRGFVRDEVMRRRSTGA